MARKRTLTAAALVVLAVTQVTAAPPTTNPKDGLAVSPEEYRKKLDALNQAATRPQSVVRDDAALVKSRRASYLAQKQRQVDAARAEIARTYEIEQLAEKELPVIKRKLADVRAAGRNAELQLGALLDRYDLASAMAWRAGHSSFGGEATTEFNGTAEPRSGYGGEMSIRGSGSTRFSGTTFDPSKQLEAIMAVEDRYGPELKAARQHLSELFQEQHELARRGTQLVEASKEARLARARAINRGTAAGMAAARLAGATTQQPQRQGRISGASPQQHIPVST